MPAKIVHKLLKAFKVNSILQMHRKTDYFSLELQRFVCRKQHLELFT